MNTWLNIRNSETQSCSYPVVLPAPHHPLAGHQKRFGESRSQTAAPLTQCAVVCLHPFRYTVDVVSELSNVILAPLWEKAELGGLILKQIT